MRSPYELAVRSETGSGAWWFAGRRPSWEAACDMARRLLTKETLPGLILWSEVEISMGVRGASRHMLTGTTATDFDVPEPEWRKRPSRKKI